jgi:hypothetical protein
MIASLRLLVRRAGPQVFAYFLPLRDLPVAFVPEDIPDAPAENALWYGAAAGLASIPAEARSDDDRERAFSSFISANGVEIGRLSRRGRPPGVDVRAIHDFCLATGRWPNRRSSLALLRSEMAAHQKKIAVAAGIDVSKLASIADVQSLALPLPKPPFPDCAEPGFQIRALQTPLQMILEGERMRHCAADYVRQVSVGRSYLYSAIIAGKRLTVELLSDAQHGWRVGAARGFANRDTTRSERVRIARWEHVAISGGAP